MISSKGILYFLFLIFTHAEIIHQSVLRHHIDLCFTNVFGFEFYDLSQHDDLSSVAQHLHGCIIQQPIYANTDRQEVENIIRPEVDAIINEIKNLGSNRTVYHDRMQIFLHQIQSFLDQLVEESETFLRNVQTIEGATRKISMQSIASRVDTVPLEEMMLTWHMSIRNIQMAQNKSTLIKLLNDTKTYRDDIDRAYLWVLKAREELQDKRKEYYSLEENIKTHLTTYIDSITWV